MPIYEYRCAACGHHVEALQKMSDSPLRKCPDCGKSQLRRLVSASQFRLKGNGWYETDFKDKNERKRNLVDGAPPAEAAETAKSETTETSSESSASKAAAPAVKKPARAAKKPAPARKLAPAARTAVAAKQAARRKSAAKPRAAKRSRS